MVADVEGIYAAQFLSNADQYGEGIVVLDGGRIHGGDLDHTYAGRYSLLNNEFSATVQVTNYSGRISSVLGQLMDYQLALNGTVKEPHDITVRGTVEGRPGLTIQINLHKVRRLIHSSPMTPTAHLAR